VMPPLRLWATPSLPASKRLPRPGSPA